MADLRLAYLFSRQLNKTASDAEQEELMLLLAAVENEEQVKELFAQAWESTDLDRQVFTPEQSARMLNHSLIKDSQITTKHFKLNHLFKYISAAVLLLILSATYFYYYKEKRQNVLAAHADIAPGADAATLTLASGRKIFLSDASKGEVAEEAGVNITKTANGQVVYKISDLANADANKMNTLSTAKGEQYQVILPDGTKVWLNAASSLRFPVTFVKAHIRKVELNGEAFFEVAKDRKHPFVVKTEAQEVKVLGTQFNISAYKDERSTRTTLIEGSVQVNRCSALKEGKLLRPGQQAIVLGENIQLNNKVDLEDVLAWKNGYFKFNESLESIMNKISRWYNVEVVYQIDPGAELGFEGKISRKKTLSVLLKNIESAGGIHFKIEGRRVTVIK